MKAVLVLEDGTTFEGASFGAEGEVAGEVIFNTQVVGFQEIMTDPAYRGKIIGIGYPHVGNVGINDKSFESDQAQASAFVIKEYSRVYSNWQAKGSLEDYMKKNKVIGIEGIDTQALTVHIRDNGEMKGVVSTKDFSKNSLVGKAKAYDKSQIPSTKSQTIPKSQSSKSKTIIIDLGVNNSTLGKFPGARVVASDTSAEKILAKEPEQVVISSGPVDPTKLAKTIDEVKKLVGKVPIYGIQNGACILAQALGCTVSRMKVGHHGANLPVVDPNTGVGDISVQNHSYGIDKLSENVKVVHVNLNDKTVEKIQSRDGSCVATLYFPIDERGKLEPGYKYV
ncbi:glutamine-hydrolyzing carbamoyl-phosphate synthase small subunit [Candidatus Margulisiibacteriota bacterium]